MSLDILMTWSIQHISWSLLILVVSAHPIMIILNWKVPRPHSSTHRNPLDNIPDKMNIEHLFESLNIDAHSTVRSFLFLWIESNIHAFNSHSEQAHSVIHNKPFKYLKTAIISLLSLPSFSFDSPSYFNHSVSGSSPHMWLALSYLHISQHQPSLQCTQSGFQTSALMTVRSLPFLNWILLLGK